MGLFNFFGDSEHRVFDYKPVYFNKEEDERKRKFGAVDGSEQRARENGTYTPGASIKGAFRDGNYQINHSHTTKVQTIIGIVTMILLVVVLYFIAKFYSLL